MALVTVESPTRIGIAHQSEGDPMSMDWKPGGIVYIEKGISLVEEGLLDHWYARAAGVRLVKGGVSEAALAASLAEQRDTSLAASYARARVAVEDVARAEASARGEDPDEAARLAVANFDQGLADREAARADGKTDLPAPGTSTEPATSAKAGEPGPAPGAAPPAPTARPAPALTPAQKAAAADKAAKEAAEKEAKAAADKAKGAGPAK